MTTPDDRSHIATEAIDPLQADLHTLSVADLLTRMQHADTAVLAATEAATPALETFLQAAEPGFTSGGRLIYLGAGTSGRLGVLDASECPPTFRLPPERIIGLIAGGDGALRRSSEGAEDDPAGAIEHLTALTLTPADSVVGIAAGGTTPYVRGALAWAAGLARPPVTALLCCAEVSAPAAGVHVIAAPTGAELIAGSTRLKAGTATKLICNRITTTLAIREGRVYRGLMVDMRASNSKLRDRAARILRELDCATTREDAFTLLDAADGAVKTAVVMHRQQCERSAAENWLADHAGRLAALDANHISPD